MSEHHAYVCEGIDDTALRAWLSDSGVTIEGNPDIHRWDFQMLKVDDARAIRMRAAQKPLGERQYFLIVCAGITAEAQNALLKSLEEPQGRTTFLIALASIHSLLPTVRSRIEVIPSGGEHGTAPVVSFIRATPEERLEKIKEMLPKEADERDMRAIMGFLVMLEERLGKMSPDLHRSEALRALYAAKKGILASTGSPKILLESLALLVPGV